MILKHTLEKQGNFLFRYRGQLPVILFIMAIPFIFSMEHPQPSSLKNYFFSFSLAVSAIGFLIRCLTTGYTHPETSGRNRDKQVAELLNTTGVYSIVRHPLYIGNFLMWLGISLYTFNIIFILLAMIFFFVIYERIIYAEESYLENKFGVDFLYWAAITPAFIPSFRHVKKPDRKFSCRKVFANEYSGLLALVFAFIYVDTLRNWNIHGIFTPDKEKMTVLAVTLILVLIIRFVKHHTSWLKYN